MTKSLLLLLLALVFVATTATTSAQQQSDQLKIITNVTLKKGIDRIQASCVDNATSTLYLGAWTAPGSITKFDAVTSSMGGTVYLNIDENYVSFVVFRPADAASSASSAVYAGCYGDSTTTPPGVVVKIDPVSMARVSSVALNADETEISAGVLLANTSFLIVGTATAPGRLVKLQVGDVFQRLSALTLQNSEDSVSVLHLGSGSGGFLWVGLATTAGAGPQVVRVDATGEKRESALALLQNEDHVGAIYEADTVSNVIWVACKGALIKIQADPVKRLGWLALYGQPSAAYYDSERKIAFITMRLWPALVYIINHTSSPARRMRGVWAPSGDRLPSGLLRPNSSTAELLIPTDDSAASLLSFDADSLNFSAPDSVRARFAGGEALVTVIATSRNDEYAFGVTDTRPGIAVKMNALTLERVAAVAFEVGTGDYLRSLVIDAWSRGYASSCGNAPSAIVKFDINAMTTLPAFVGDSGDHCFHSLALSPRDTEMGADGKTPSAEYMFATTYLAFDDSASLSAARARLIKFKITSAGMSRVANVEVPIQLFTAAAVDPVGGHYIVWGSYASGPGLVFRYALGNKAEGGAAEQTQLQLPNGEGQLSACVLWKNHAYFISSRPDNAVLIVDVTATPMKRIGRVKSKGVTYHAAAALGGGSALFAAKQKLFRMKLAESTLSVEQEIALPVVGAVGVISAGGSAKNHFYLATYEAPSEVFLLQAPPGAEGAPPEANPVFLIVLLVLVGLLVLAVVIFIAYSRGKKKGAAEAEEPMLQVPRQTMTIVHQAMSAPPPLDRNNDPYLQGVDMTPMEGQQPRSQTAMDAM